MAGPVDRRAFIRNGVAGLTTMSSLFLAGCSGQESNSTESPTTSSQATLSIPQPTVESLDIPEPTVSSTTKEPIDSGEAEQEYEFTANVENMGGEGRISVTLHWVTGQSEGEKVVSDEVAKENLSIQPNGEQRISFQSTQPEDTKGYVFRTHPSTVSLSVSNNGGGGNVTAVLSAKNTSKTVARKTINLDSGETRDILLSLTEDVGDGDVSVHLEIPNEA